MKTDEFRTVKPQEKGKQPHQIVPILSAICVSLGVVFLCSCSNKPTDMRSLVPADSLIYLESNDLGSAVGPIINNEAFKGIKDRPDVSALNGVQLAITISGFELKEEK